MAQQRIIETTTADGNVVERSYERDNGPASIAVNTAPTSGGSFSTIMALLLLAAIAVGGYLLFISSGREAKNDNAVTATAEEVGAAPKKAGNAADKAAGKIGN
jgi:hypothetical protein